MPTQKIPVCWLFNTHDHLREIEIMRSLICYGICGGTDVFGPMPNTNDGLCSARHVTNYVEHAQRFALEQQIWSKKIRFIPIAMMTEKTTKKDIDGWVKAGIFDCKLYPLERTTKSHNGIRDYWKILENVRYCGEVGVRVHFHPEHPWLEIPGREAEYLFVPIIDMFIRSTNAIIIWEHGTDARCIPYWKSWAKTGRFYVTLTAHHLATDEDETFGDPRATCKPSIKTSWDKNGLRVLVAENHKWVMAGGDSAYHEAGKKHVQSGRPACGAFTAPFLLSLYAHDLQNLLKTKQGLRTFNRFIRRNAERLYGFPRSKSIVVLLHKKFRIPLTYPIGSKETAVPFWAGQEIDFCIQR